jgi:hypothetical protein
MEQLGENEEIRGLLLISYKYAQDFVHRQCEFILQYLLSRVG